MSILEDIDSAFQVWGRAAPPMRADENNSRYIRRIARIAKNKNYLSYDEQARKLDYDAVPDEYLPKFTPMLVDGIRRGAA